MEKYRGGGERKNKRLITNGGRAGTVRTALFCNGASEGEGKRPKLRERQKKKCKVKWGGKRKVSLICIRCNE